MQKKQEKKARKPTPEIMIASFSLLVLMDEIKNQRPALANLYQHLNAFIRPSKLINRLWVTLVLSYKSFSATVYYRRPNETFVWFFNLDKKYLPNWIRHVHWITILSWNWINFSISKMWSADRITIF